jgi:hypothetical protein
MIIKIILAIVFRKTISQKKGGHNKGAVEKIEAASFTLAASIF